jgi:hypothetical protein
MLAEMAPDPGAVRTRVAMTLGELSA